MLSLLLASLVPNVRAERSACDQLFSSQFRISPNIIATRLDQGENAKLAFECFDSLVTLTDEQAKKTMDGVKNFTELYAFVDDLSHPPAVMEMEPYDIMGRLNSIQTDNVKPFKFYMELEDAFAHAQDAHTSFSLPCYSGAFVVMQPLKLCPVQDGQDVKFFTCSQQLYTFDRYDFPAGEEIESINDMEPMEFMESFADLHTLTGRDQSQRFELLLGSHNMFSIRDMLKVTDGALSTDEFQFTQLQVKLTNGSTYDIPLLLLALSGIDDSYVTICADDDANLNAKNLMHSVKVDIDSLVTARIGTLEPVLPRVKLATSPYLRINPFKVRAQRKFSDTSKLHLPQAVRRSYDNAAEFYFYDFGERCILQVYTFGPDDLDDWLNQMLNVLIDAKEAGCGVVTGVKDGKPQGKRLVIDVRQNGGGYTVLLDIFTSALFRSRTPPHFSIDTKRLSASQEAVVEELAHYEGPDADLTVRESYSFKPAAICGGKYEVGCEGWRDAPIQRHGQAYSQPLHSGPPFWEVTETNPSKLSRWLRMKSVEKRYGYDAAAMAIIKEIHGYLEDYEPDPELTLVLTGYTSASCTAQFATRALSNGLGAVIRQGYAGHKPKMAALVPGGNVFQHSLLAEEGVVVPLPNGADVALTTMGTIAYTHDMAPEDDPNTPLEFVVLPPHNVFGYWEDSDFMDAEQSMILMLQSLEEQVPIGTCVKGLHSHFFDEGCDASLFPHAASVGRLCNEQTGEYSGDCGVQRCELGYELREGKCESNGFVTPDPLKIGLPGWATALIVIICLVAIAGIAFGVFFAVKRLSVSRAPPMYGAQSL